MNSIDREKNLPYTESDSDASTHIASVYYSTRDSLCEDYPFLQHNLELNTLCFDTYIGNTVIDKDSSDEAILNDTDCGESEKSEYDKQSFYDPIVNKFFRDGIRPIDLILVWDQLDPYSNSQKCHIMRKSYENNLRNEGLELEYESDPSGLRFIKISARKNTLRKYSEVLKLRMPMKQMEGLQVPQNRQNRFLRNNNKCFPKLMKFYSIDSNIFPSMKNTFTAVYSRDKEYLFDVDSPEFFTQATRSRIALFILDRTRFSIDHPENLDNNDDFSFGIDRLISIGVYSAVYPLHDGILNSPGSMRSLLYAEWASFKKCFQRQPLDCIKEYFGVKIALYFAWLGFYTYMLLFASIVGIVCFIYGLITLSNNKPTQDICKPNVYIKMCPLCDNFCNFWNLGDTCVHAKVTYLFDNISTIFFAIFMSLWATLFLELWKNYSAEITHRWDLTNWDVQEEHPRPKYLIQLAHNKKKTVDFVANKVEPHVPFWKTKLPATIFSCSVMLLLMTVAMAAVIGVVLYRMSLSTALPSSSKSPMVTSYAILLKTVTAAIINLFFIYIFNWIYIWLAKFLTELEFHRTQTEFDDSLTLKIYLLKFINFYSSTFYIAFFKGKFIGHPGHLVRIFGYRQEECSPGGCLSELSIQLSIIMIGKQAINSILEIMLPLFRKWLNTIRISAGLKNSDTKERKPSKMYLQWVRDYKLVEWGPRGLFPEHLEMVLQYGFITIFVAAFPLAPVFALINNIIELRLDAKKLLTIYRRPIIQRVRNIGVWYKIVDSISKLSVITNAFIIAFTSNFIPRLVYQFTISEDKSLTGFLQYSLSEMNINDLETAVAAISDTNHTNHYERQDICYYLDYREPPDSPQKYNYRIFYWHTLAARLAFVVIFENIVAFVMILIRWIIPDISPKLKEQIRREAHITNEIIIRHETQRACKMPCGNNIDKHSKNIQEIKSQWNTVLGTSRNISASDNIEMYGESRIAPTVKLTDL